jgi:dihydrofolate synthase/folylpolyglutamate synthase
MTSPSGRALSYLAVRTRFGVKFGLETIRALVGEMGHPERSFVSLLVAGTNGKGSVVAYVDAVLRASGLKTGRYTSPHLVRVNERIAVDGRDITSRDLETAVGRVRRAAERLKKAGTIPAHPTYFEALTATAFEHFRREAVDVAVLEVGMGGRLDATNVAEPLASAIVSIDFDHEVYLGRTLARIATEKAGVLRRGRTTVLGRLPAEARRAIARVARDRASRLVDAYRGATLLDRADGLEVRTELARYRSLLPLPGAHQRDNLLVALRLLEEARQAGVAVDLGRVSAGIQAARWPGRLEWIEGDPPLLLDGAHNPAGARALAAHLGRKRPFVLLFGVMADKDVPALGRLLFPLAAEVVLTEPRVSRAASPAMIARRAGDAARGARRVADSRAGLALARELAKARGPGVPVVVAGSLYLVGEVLAQLSAVRAGRKRSRPAAGSDRGPRGYPTPRGPRTAP